MISGVFGLPGAGKSLFLASLADRALRGKPLKIGGQKFGAFKKYKYVYTNFPFDGAYRLDFEKLGKVEITDALILVDEIMNFADSRNFRNFGDNLKFFFSQHRKDRIDLVYCSQAYDDVDKKIRNVTEHYYYICRWVSGISSLRPIKAFFRVDGDITNGYEYAHWTKYCYFFRRKYYKLIDTNYKVSKSGLKLEKYTPKPWKSEGEDSAADQQAVEVINEKKDKKVIKFFKKLVGSGKNLFGSVKKKLSGLVKRKKK